MARTLEEKRAAQREHQRKYREANREKLREHTREYDREWRANNLELARERQRNYTNKWRATLSTCDHERQLINSAKARANKCGLAFNIDETDITIPDTCPVLGIPLQRGSGAVTDGSPSLDRIDNTKGYVRGNVHVISFRANRLKNNATAEELEAVARWMRAHEPLTPPPVFKSSPPGRS